MRYHSQVQVLSEPPTQQGANAWVQPPVTAATPLLWLRCKLWFGPIDRTLRATRTIEARHPSERRAQSALVAPSERGCLFQADAVRERISMPMHELPFGPFTAIDLCDPQRPVLLL